MNKQILVAGVLGLASLRGQVLNNNNELFQTMNVLDQTMNALNRTLDEGFGNRVIKAKPFSATEERHSLQVLGDGTRIENTETNRLYRDGEGRTRVEEMNGKVSIYDPVAKFSVELDPATKTARKGNGMGGFSYVVDDALRGLKFSVGQGTRSNPGTMKGVMSETTENLGSQSVNGVTAQGIRTTMTIPKGQIGNNKDIKVLTERWTSSDLQMLVKSINSDPRFGDTTYQLTKVVQSAPDPGLFQIPPDYTVVDQTRPGVQLKELNKALKALPALPPAPPAPPVKQ
jgi:hypothetical protein